jgi:hypothetical protein
VAILYGWYANPEKSLPGVDPGPEQLCPICGQLVGYGDAVRGDIDLGTERKFYYRLHSGCSEKRSKKWVDDLIITAIALDGMSTLKVQRCEGVN